MALDNLVAPVVGLALGPATEASARVMLNLDVDDDRDDDKLALNLNAANQFVAGLRIAKAHVALVVPDPADPKPWPYSLVLATTLLTARWFRRSNSPAGVVDLGGEAGVAYVQRNDPDIAQMLGLGPYTRPAVG